jgi:hypothetical protein
MLKRWFTFEKMQCNGPVMPVYSQTFELTLNKKIVYCFLQQLGAYSVENWQPTPTRLLLSIYFVFCYISLFCCFLFFKAARIFMCGEIIVTHEKRSVYWIPQSCWWSLIHILQSLIQARVNNEKQQVTQLYIYIMPYACQVQCRSLVQQTFV